MPQSDWLVPIAVPASIGSADEPALRRSGLVSVRDGPDFAAGRLPVQLALSLFDDASLSVTLDRGTSPRPGVRTWSGVLTGQTFSRVVLVRSDGLLAGAIHAGDGTVYELRPAGPGRCRVRELDASRLNLCPRGHPPGATPESGGTPAGDPRAGQSPDTQALTTPPAGCDDGSIIDLMVVYSPRARQMAGGTTALNALIDLAVADTNDALERSLINTRVRLVHAHEAPYAETGDFVLDLNRLLDPGDGYLDEVPLLRDQYGADCVSLWVDDYGGGGFGWYPDSSLRGVGASGITIMGYAGAAYLTLAHELGHNLWCAHDHETHDTNEPFDVPFADYSYGYREPGEAWHDIMAYPPGVMIPYFANPNLTWPGPEPPNPGPIGVPAGQPGAADLALTINQTRHIVANFRPTTAPGLPPVIFVRADAPAGGDGLGWATAFKDLQTALCKAAGSNGGVKEIWVASGVYKPDRGSADRTATFQLVSGLALYGGFAGTETLRTQRNPTVHLSILSGDVGQPGVLTDNCFHVVTGTGADATAVLDGFTVTGGYADGAGNSHDGGGGLLNDPGGNPTIANCVFTANTAARFGGAVYNHLSAAPTFIHCVFIGNTSLGADWPSGGGAIYNSDHCHPVITGCTFTGNSGNLGGAIGNVFQSHPQVSSSTFARNTTTGANAEGGGAYFYDRCEPVFNGCVFKQNTARSGGAIYAHSGCLLNLTDCSMTGNTAGAGSGGGVYGYNQCQTTALRCLFAENTGDFGGAMANLFGSASTLTHCILRGNRSSGDAGAVANYADSPATLVNCLLAGNSCAGGGAAVGHWFNSSARIINCTVVGNLGQHAGAVYGYSSSPTLANSILWDNRQGFNIDQNAQLQTDAGTTTIHHCIVSGWNASFGGVANTGLPPPFADADGPDDLFGTPDDNPRLRGPVGAAIDSGDDASVPDGVISDLDGRPRFLNSAVDRGAFEFDPAISGDFDHDGDVDATDMEALRACPSAPAVPRSPPCQAQDLDGDNDVDQADHALFQRCYNGKDRPPAPTCGT